MKKKRKVVKKKINNKGLEEREKERPHMRVREVVKPTQRPDLIHECGLVESHDSSHPSNQAWYQSKAREMPVISQPSLLPKNGQNADDLARKNCGSTYYHHHHFAEFIARY